MIDFLNEHFDSVLIFVFGVISTTIGAVTNSFLQQKQQISKTNIDRQNEIYFSALTLLEKLMRQKYLIFDESFIDSLFEVKAKIKLFASNKVSSKFEELWDYVMTIYGNYKKFRPECYYSCSSDYDNPNCTLEEFQRYEDEIDTYKEQHGLDSDKLRCLIKSLTQKMKIDLKVK